LLDGCELLNGSSGRDGGGFFNGGDSDGGSFLNGGGLLNGSSGSDGGGFFNGTNSSGFLNDSNGGGFLNGSSGRIITSRNMAAKVGASSMSGLMSSINFF
jgi:hypothetical protein